MRTLSGPRPRLVLAAALAVALPAAAPLFAQAVQPAAAKPPADELSAWFEGYFAWSPGEVKAEELAPVRLPGYKLYRVTKTSAIDPRGNDMIYGALEEGGKSVLVGLAFVDEDRAKDPRPIRVDADLDPLRQRLKKAMRSGFRLSLDPSHDRRSFKGVKIALDTGYGYVDIPAFVKADDGSFMLMGRVWDRSRSFAEQRREIIKLEGVPAQGPANARVTIVEFSDMQCGFCKRRTNDFEPLIAKLEKDLKIRRYIKSFPLSEHAWAFRAASAGVCFFQRSPELFFRWKAQVYKRQQELDVAQLDNFALDFAVGNEVPDDAFRACYLQGKSIARVLQDMSEGYALGVLSTPTYFVDGVRISWSTDNLMEEFLRKTYLKGAGLPLPTPVPKTPAPGATK